MSRTCQCRSCGPGLVAYGSAAYALHLPECDRPADADRGASSSSPPPPCDVDDGTSSRGSSAGFVDNAERDAGEKPRDPPGREAGTS
jgi:hypothetical protein